MNGITISKSHLIIIGIIIIMVFCVGYLNVAKTQVPYNEKVCNDVQVPYTDKVCGVVQVPYTDKVCNNVQVPYSTSVCNNEAYAYSGGVTGCTVSGFWSPITTGVVSVTNLQSRGGTFSIKYNVMVRGIVIDLNTESVYIPSGSTVSKTYTYSGSVDKCGAYITPPTGQVCNDAIDYRSELRCNDMTKYRSETQCNDVTKYRSETQCNDVIKYRTVSIWQSLFGSN
jgi:hypothetical protein